MKLFRLFFLLSCFIGSSCQDSNSSQTVVANVQSHEAAPIFHSSHEPKKQNAPFSDVVQVGNVYYLAGQIGMDHQTRVLVEGGIESETIQALENIKDVLSQHQMEMKDVVKATVILSDISNFAAFNAIYVNYFPQKPVRTTFAASGLARGAQIEIEVMAVKN